jgi:hypothetical protein
LTIERVGDAEGGQVRGGLRRAGNLSGGDADLARIPQKIRITAGRQGCGWPM